MLGRQLDELDHREPSAFGDLAIRIVQLRDRVVHAPRFAWRTEAALSRQCGQVDKPAERTTLIEYRFAGDEALLQSAVLPRVVRAHPQTDLAGLGYRQQLAVVASPQLGPAFARHAEIRRDPRLPMLLGQH